MDYLYKITIGIDDDKVLSMRQHDLNAVYKTVRNTFARCNFKEQESENGNLVFTIGKGKDSFSEVGIATGFTAARVVLAVHLYILPIRI